MAISVEMIRLKQFHDSCRGGPFAAVEQNRAQNANFRFNILGGEMTRFLC